MISKEIVVILLLWGCKTGELRFIKGVAEGQIKPVRKIEKLTFYQSLQRSSKYESQCLHLRVVVSLTFMYQK